MRAAAVLLVIASHAGIPGFAGGYVGVDMFFVISGYVITQLLLRETGKGAAEGMADFYSRRVRRIVPAATATLLGTLVAGEVLTGGRLPRLTGDVRWASLFAANFRLIRTGSGYFVPGVAQPLITQFWSLAVEEQFYLVFPLVVFLVARYSRRRHPRQVLSVVLTVGVAASAFWSLQISATEPTSAYYSPLTRFWELGVGCLLATVISRYSRRRRGSETAAGLIGVGLLIAALAVLGPRSVYPGWLAWLPCGSAALLIWSGAGEGGTATARLLSSRGMVFVGDISYSLYLVHYAWLNLPGQLRHPLTGWGWKFIEICGTFATAVASYYFLENPIRSSSLLARDRLSVALLLGVCIAAVWAAAAIAGLFVLNP